MIAPPVASRAFVDVLQSCHRREAPLPARLRLACEFAVLLAKWGGVTFAPGQIDVRAYRGLPHEPCMTYDNQTPALVYLNLAKADASIRAWTWVILHEFKHCLHDESEPRADAFADLCIKNWERLAEIARAIGALDEDE